MSSAFSRPKFFNTKIECRNVANISKKQEIWYSTWFNKHVFFFNNMIKKNKQFNAKIKKNVEMSLVF